jgi:mercuric ion transport protein
MENSPGMQACCCHKEQPVPPMQQPIQQSKPRKTIKVISSTALSVVIAFFPKCPMCWAAYMSMFGSVGLANLPYMRWLLPVLFIFLALNLYLMFRRVRQNGYLPFVASLAGAIIILCGRTYFPHEKWLLITGMALIISGSLLNNFFHLRSRNSLLQAS